MIFKGLIFFKPVTTDWIDKKKYVDVQVYHTTKSFLENYWQLKWKNKCYNEQASISRSVDFRHKHLVNVGMTT